MNAASPVALLYRSLKGHTQRLDIPAKGLVILSPGEENRRLLGALVAEARRRIALDSTTYSLIKPELIITSELPPLTFIRIQAFCRSSYPLYHLLTLEESLCALTRTGGAECPVCTIEALATPLPQLFPKLLELFQGQAVLITLHISEPPHHARAVFSEVLRDGLLLDTLDLPDDELAPDGPVIGGVFRGRISLERESVIRDALRVCEEYPNATIQVRAAEPPFPVMRHLGSRPTCPKCGRSTYALTPHSLSAEIQRFQRDKEDSPLSWHPPLRDILFRPLTEIPEHLPFFPSVFATSLRFLRDVGITAPLATPISELSLRERLCLRFLSVTPTSGGILLIELPSYGLSEDHADALTRWLSGQKEEWAGIIALGGDELVSDVATMIVEEGRVTHPRDGEVRDELVGGQASPVVGGDAPGDDGALFGQPEAQPPTLHAVTPRQANHLADTLLQSRAADSPWKIIDLAAIILDHPPSSRPLLGTLPIFKRFTNLYAQVTAARVLGITPRVLNLSGPHSARCEECGGLGKIFEESRAITCVRCSGSRFKPHIEQLIFRGLPFPALFTHTAEDLVPFFRPMLPIVRELTLLSQMGLGHVVLGTPEDALPLDIRLRAELISACASSPKGKRLLIRGLSGIFSPKELASMADGMSSLATDRALHIVHDGARR